MTTTTRTLAPFRIWTSSGNPETPATLRANIIRSDQIAQATRFALVTKAALSARRAAQTGAALPRQEDIALVETWLPAAEDLLAAVWDNEEDAIYDTM